MAVWRRNRNVPMTVLAVHEPPFLWNLIDQRSAVAVGESADPEELDDHGAADSAILAAAAVDAAAVDIVPAAGDDDDVAAGHTFVGSGCVEDLGRSRDYDNEGAWLEIPLLVDNMAFFRRRC